MPTWAGRAVGKPMPVLPVVWRLDARPELNLQSGEIAGLLAAVMALDPDGSVTASGDNDRTRAVAGVPLWGFTCRRDWLRLPSLDNLSQPRKINLYA